MNQSNVTLFDLPNEILFIIFNELNNTDVLYSLLNVDNERVDTIVQQNTFTNTLNFTLTTINDDILSLSDLIRDRFCIDILPKIHYNVKTLILESGSMERILLVADYPNLTELKIFNVNDHVVLHYFVVQSPLQRIFQEQITDLILVYKNNIDMETINSNTKYVYEYVLKCFRNLKYLSVIGCISYLSVKNVSSTTWLSLNLHKLCVDICGFNDCFALLDGRLKQLRTFIVEIGTTDDDILTNYNMNDLPNMKCFSLRCDCLADEYNTRIVPLLRRMIKLEELTLNIINVEQTMLIDGTQMNDKILIHMPYLRQFTFYITTEVELNHLTHYPSNEDVQRSFTNIGYQQVCCILTNSIDSVICNVFSLPFAFDALRYIGNTFPALEFCGVTKLLVHDKNSFEHEFFIRIARSFPSLKKLHVLNCKPQLQMQNNAISNNNELYSTVEYPNLISVDLTNSHIHYVDQFLNQRKAHLPNLIKLTVAYDKLKFVTKNFTRDATRRDCGHVKQLVIYKTIVHSKEFYDYFPFL